jgi:hypothetical protein
MGYVRLQYALDVRDISWKEAWLWLLATCQERTCRRVRFPGACFPGACFPGACFPGACFPGACFPGACAGLHGSRRHSRFNSSICRVLVQKDEYIGKGVSGGSVTKPLIPACWAALFMGYSEINPPSCHVLVGKDGNVGQTMSGKRTEQASSSFRAQHLLDVGVGCTQRSLLCPFFTSFDY